MILWMEISRDRLELPLAVADTVSELARMRNTTASAICQSMKYQSLHNKKPRYIKIEIKD